MNEMDTRFANQFNIQWFPGHMTKTLRMMEQEIQHVDASLVLLDARIPLSIVSTTRKRNSPPDWGMVNNALYILFTSSIMDITPPLTV